MNTLLISSEESLDPAVTLLQNGGLVAVPTETVYGLAADGLNAEAVAKIFTAKGRPSDNPLILHISRPQMLEHLALEISSSARRLMHAFWPGPLTLVFHAQEHIPSNVRGGLDTIAVRLPDHPIMQRLIDSTNLPLAAPSANTSGRPSPTNAKRVLEDLSGKIDAVIDGGACTVGLESTVLDTTTTPPTLLRPGMISKAMIEAIIGPIDVDPTLIHHDEVTLPKSPGMKYKHYAPHAEVVIFKGDTPAIIDAINTRIVSDHDSGKRTGVLVTHDLVSSISGADELLDIGERTDPGLIASRLFEYLRRLDDAHVDVIYTHYFGDGDTYWAIINRLEKSSGYHIITL